MTNCRQEQNLSGLHERRLHIVAGSTWRGDARLSHRSRLRPRSWPLAAAREHLRAVACAEPVGHVWQNDDIRPTGVEILQAG